MRVGFFPSFSVPQTPANIFYRKRGRQQREAWTPFFFQRGANQTFPSSSQLCERHIALFLPPSLPLLLSPSLSLCLSLSLPHTQSYRAPYTDLAAELGGPILNIRSLPHIFGRDFYAPFALACQICQVFLFCEAKLYSTDVLAHFFFSLPVQFSSVVKQLELADESKPHSSKNYNDQVS